MSAGVGQWVASKGLVEQMSLTFSITARGEGRLGEMEDEGEGDERGREIAVVVGVASVVPDEDADGLHAVACGYSDGSLNAASFPTVTYGSDQDRPGHISASTDRWPPK